MRGDALPDKAFPESVLSESVLRGEAFPDKTLPEPVLSEMALRGETLPDKALPELVLSETALRGEALPDKTLPEPILSETSLRGETLPGAFPESVLSETALRGEALPDKAFPESVLSETALRGEALPDKAFPEPVLSETALRGEALPDKAFPESVLSETALRGEALPDNALPESVLSETALRGEALPDSALPESVLSEMALRGESLPDKTLPEPVLSETALRGETLPDKALPESVLTKIPVHRALAGRTRSTLFVAQETHTVWQVKELARAITKTLKERFCEVSVRGEISHLLLARSGHLYFRLKDSEAVLSGVCFRNFAQRLTYLPQEGQEIIADGHIGCYADRSQYQLVARSLRAAGAGTLLQILENRRRKLAAEGLFDSTRKRDVPRFPACIGLITSPDGAALQDIRNCLQERLACKVLLWPTLVQGRRAATRIAEAIEGFNNLPETGWPCRPDVLVVARGGGSLEDLWAYNAEVVVRAAAASKIPLISGVGHESDTTLIDHAASLRVPTPSAAGEKVAPARRHLAEALEELRVRLHGCVMRMHRDGEKQLQHTFRRAGMLHHPLKAGMQRLDASQRRLRENIHNLMNGKKLELRAIPCARPPLEAGMQRLEVSQRRLRENIRNLIDRKKLELRAIPCARPHFLLLRMNGGLSAHR